MLYKNVLLGIYNICDTITLVEPFDACKLQNLLL